MKTSKDELIRKAAEITNVQWDVYKSYESCIGPSDTHETTFSMMMKWGAYIEGFSELFGLDSLDFIDFCQVVRHEVENDRR